MKIPTGTPNGAPYYGPPVNGIEMNPQWQGNGVMIDQQAPTNGAGYIMPHVMNNAPPYPPPAEYYAPGISPPAPPQAPQDFSEYMWMEHEEEYDKQVMQQLEEQALMEQCIEAMLADEQEAQNRGLDISIEEQASKSTLNPLAAEFVPGSSMSSMVVVSASDLDAQPGSSLSCNTPKSIESSMSELSISQASDGHPESSKSSTAEVGEECCNLPLDSSPIKEASDEQSIEQVAPETDEKLSVSVEATTDDSAKPESKSEDSIVTVSVNDGKSVSKADLTKSVAPKSLETKPTKKTETSEQINDDAKESPEPESVEIASEAESIPVVSAITPPATSTTPAAPPVFNYAAAARANLPSKSASPAAAPASKPEAAAKEPQPAPAQPAAAPAASKPPTKQPIKSSKPTKDTKEPGKSGPGFSKSAAAPKKNKK